MSCVSGERTAMLLGNQTPRYRSVPDYVRSSGPDVVDLCAALGLHLDPWECNFLTDALGENPDGTWASMENCIIVSRQNGKGAIFEARVYAGLFLFDERLIMYSAHEFKTATEMFRRMRERIEGNADFSRRVRRVYNSHGDEGIELMNGQRLRVIARSRASGRGFTGHCNIWDEAQILSDHSVDALMPTMSAVANPQIYYGATAADKETMPCDQLARVRERGISGKDGTLTFHEFSVPRFKGKCLPECGGARDEDGNRCRHDITTAVDANPGLGYRTTERAIRQELRSMSPEGYDRERLGIGNYPTIGEPWGVIPRGAWDAARDVWSQLVGAVAISIDVMPMATSGAIAVAGRRSDGLAHWEITSSDGGLSVDHQEGTAWIVPRFVSIYKKLQTTLGIKPTLVMDPDGPAGFLIDQIERAMPRIKILKLTRRQSADACQQMYKMVVPDEGKQSEARHLGQRSLDDAVAQAAKKDVGDGAWVWTRRGSSGDIAPLVAVTQAEYGYKAKRPASIAGSLLAGSTS